MKIVLECEEETMLFIEKAVRLACPGEGNVYIMFTDEEIYIKDTGSEMAGVNSWIEINLKDLNLFKNYIVQSKKPHNLIVLEVVKFQLVEALKACDSFTNTDVTIKLGKQTTGTQGMAFLSFNCTVKDEGFNFVKQVDSVLIREPEDLISEMPGTVDAELTFLPVLQQVLKPLNSEAFLQVGLTVEKCGACKKLNQDDYEYVFRCDHSRAKVEVENCGKLTLRTIEADPVHVVSVFRNIVLEPGLCSLHTIQSSVRVRHLLEIIQRVTFSLWDKVVLGITNNEGLTISLTKRDDLHVKFIIPAFVEAS